jgi:hypothetical protein
MLRKPFKLAPVQFQHEAFQLFGRTPFRGEAFSEDNEEDDDDAFDA